MFLHYLNFIAIDLHLYKILKIMRVLFLAHSVHSVCVVCIVYCLIVCIVSQAYAISGTDFRNVAFKNFGEFCKI